MTKSLLLAVLALLIYLPSLKGEFLSWDDDIYIQKNTMIKNNSFSGVLKVLNPFGRPYFNKYSMLEDYSSEYFPVRDIFLWLQHRIFGDNPLGYHAFSVGIHVLSTLFVYWIIRALAGHELMAFGFGAIFAVHPVNVEAVSWISAQKDTLSAMFFLTCFLFYIHNFNILSLVFFAVSVLTKPTIAMTTLILASYKALYHNEKNLKYYVYEFWPYVAFSVAFMGLFRFHALKGLPTNQIIPLNIITPLEGIVSTATYLVNIFFPFNLKIIYNISLNPQSLILSFLVIICVVIIIHRHLKKDPVIPFGLLWFIIVLIPYFLVYKGMAMSDRYLYLPSIGILLSVIWYLSRIDFGVNKYMFFLVIFFLSILTLKREGIWRDSMTLWLRAADESPENWIVHYKLGTLYGERGNWDTEKQEYERAIALSPTALPPLRNLGAIMIREGKYDRAIKFFEKAVEAHPEYPETHRFLGALYLKVAGDRERGIFHLRRSLELDPHQPGADALRKAIYGRSPD